MSNLQVRIPKPIFVGVLLSIAASIAAAMVIYEIEIHIPTTAFAQLNEFSQINRNNPRTLGSHLHNVLVPQVKNFDEFVATPLAMFIGGATFGYFLRKLVWAQRRKLRAGIIAGIALSSIITLLDIVVSEILPRLIAAVGLTGVAVPLPQFDAMTDLITGLQFASSAAAYIVGVWLINLHTKAQPLTPAGAPTAIPKTRKSTIA